MMTYPLDIARARMAVTRKRTYVQITPTIENVAPDCADGKYRNGVYRTKMLQVSGWEIWAGKCCASLRGWKMQDWKKCGHKCRGG